MQDGTVARRSVSAPPVLVVTPSRWGVGEQGEGGVREMGGEAENTRGRETAGEGWRSQIAKKVFNDYDESKVVVVLVVTVVVAGSGACHF